MTEASTGFSYLLAGEDVSIDLAREVQATQLLEGVVGANSAPVVGSKHGGKVKFKIPMRSLKVGWDPTTSIATAGVLPPEAKLLAIMLGCDTGNAIWSAAYAAAAASLITADGDNIGVAYSGAIPHVPGAFFVSAAADGSTPPKYSNLATGWIEAKDTASTPRMVTLFEGAAVAPAVGDNVYPTATLALTVEQPTPMTIRYVGSNAALAYVLVGAVCEQATITMGARQVPILELTYVCTSHRRDAALGGLQLPGKFERVQPSIGIKGARLTLGGTVRAGIADLKIDLMAALAFIDSHNAPQGVAECIVVSRTVKITCSISINSDDTLVDGASPIEQLLESGDILNGLCLTTGTKPGQLVSIFCPAVRVVGQPKVADKAGFLVETVEFEAAAYTSDIDPLVTNVAPADSVLRIAFA